MPIEYSVERKHKLVTIRDRGANSLAEVEACIERLLTDAALDADYRMMVVVSESAFFPNHEEVRAIVMHMGWLQAKFHGRIALVNTATGRAARIMMLAMMADGSGAKVRAFFLEREARQWLLEEQGACPSAPDAAPT